jgi:hypothetical protein
MLGEGLNQAHKATLGIEPGVGSQLLVEGLQGFDDAGHTEGVVALGAVEGSNDQVDDTQVEYLSSGLFNSYAFFFLFKALHELFSISILASHNIADTEVGQYNGSYAEQIVHLSSYEWLVVPDSITVLVLLKEENVSDVEFPDFVLTAEFGTLSEDLFDHGIVLQVPVSLGLHHQHRDVLVKCSIILLEGRVDGLGIPCNSGILNSLGFLSESIDMFVGKFFEFPVGLIFVSLVKNKVLKEVEIVLRETLIGKVGVLSQNISSQVVMLVLAVQQD